MAEKKEKIISAKRINVIVQELKGLVSEHLLTKPILQNKLGIADWALQPTKPTYDKHAVGLGNVENTAFYKRNCFVNGATVAMAGTVNADGFTIYAPTNHGGQDGLILTSKMLSTPVWTAPTSITVGKATQLANTRKIWGQNFNGTQAVSGDMTDVGKIEANGNITTQGGVSAKGIADFSTDTQVKNVQTIDITSTGASSYTFTHNLATTDLVILAVTVSGGDVYEGYNIAFGNTVPQTSATTVGNFIRWKTNSASSITLTFRSSTYAPVTGQKIRVTIMRANY
jgi:hypothetical protein